MSFPHMMPFPIQQQHESHLQFGLLGGCDTQKEPNFLLQRSIFHIHNCHMHRECEWKGRRRSRKKSTLPISKRNGRNTFFPKTIFKCRIAQPQAAALNGKRCSHFGHTTVNEVSNLAGSNEGIITSGTIFECHLVWSKFDPFTYFFYHIRHFVAVGEKVHWVSLPFL